jgi:hypothetical protein
MLGSSRAAAQLAASQEGLKLHITDTPGTWIQTKYITSSKEYFRSILHQNEEQKIMTTQQNVSLIQSYTLDDGQLGLNMQHCIMSRDEDIEV